MNFAMYVEQSGQVTITFAIKIKLNNRQREVFSMKEDGLIAVRAASKHVGKHVNLSCSFQLKSH